MRPTFDQVKKILDKMNPHKVSPVDMMMNLMEKYSKQLESIVAERTQDDLQEKQKTDRLHKALNQIFSPIGSFRTETVSGFRFNPKIDVLEPVRTKKSSRTS
nr:retinal guanylyl cyclase 1-like [Misgurnus anguillicaudatus]